MEIVTVPQDLKILDIIKNKAVLDDTLDKEHTNCLTVHYTRPSDEAFTGTVAYFFKADFPDGGEQYLCCVKKNA